MRVLTAPVPVASSPREVLDAANPDAVLAVLLHKIVASADTEGAAEGHALLHDWLCQLAMQYNVHVRGHNSATGAEVSAQAMSRPGGVAEDVLDQSSVRGEAPARHLQVLVSNSAGPANPVIPWSFTQPYPIVLMCV
jgi:hypothetical protein